jgi:hypothetical protein
VTPVPLDGLWLLLLSLLPFILVQNWLHREVQVVFLLITRRQNMALGLFSLLFFPGVLLHETSHYLAARLVGVRTGHFSVLPQLMADGRLRLGYVETAAADPIRDGIIGAAPLLTGGLAIGYLGTHALGLGALAPLAAGGQWDAFWAGIAALPQQQDFWLWFYLTFTISSTMMPSTSDRRAWLPISIGVLVLVALALLLGAGPWMLNTLAPYLNRAMRAVAMVFGISLVLHAVLLVPVMFLRLLIGRVTGLRVV